jgi:hypothetical protein
MKLASKRQKGRRLENKIASLWRSKMKMMAVRTPGSGSGKFKGDVYAEYFTIEAKNREKVRVWEWWQQAREQKHLNKPPVLMISGNYRPILAIMDINDWLDLVKEAKVDINL